MRIFVTGSTGVVGRRLVPMLTAAGHQVTAAGRDRARLATIAAHGAATVQLDLFDREAVRRALAGHDAVVNLATHIPSSSWRMMLPGAWRENDRIRSEGSALLVDEALRAGASRFVQESFAPIYADAGDRWIDESFPVRPGRYNRSSVDAERSTERFTASGGTGIVLRFAGFYGPDSRMLHEMVAMARRGIAPLPGASDAYCSSIAHDDAASAVLAVLGAPAGIYNACDDEPLSRAAWHLALAHAAGIPVPKPMPRWMTRLMGSLGEVLSRSQRMSNAKLRATGWAPRWASAREGLRAALGPAAPVVRVDATPAPFGR
ncbi:MAG TPA: NAD(P)-dependent oxidoreductase [Gemmatimonadaceae bacterium]